MTLTIEQLAELLAGVTKAQQSIIDAIESENGGWRNTHLLPKVTSAANMRLPIPRLMDVPSRVLMRSQSRVPMDVATITRMLHEALSGETVPAAPVPTPAAAVATRAAPPPAAPVAAAAAAPAAATAGESKPTGGADDLSNFFDS